MWNNCPRLTQDELLRDIKVGMRCAACAIGKTRHIFLEIINSEGCTELILILLYKNLSDEKKEYGFLQQGSGSNHTTNSTGIPGNKIISHPL
jgi:hypothetical protein